MRKHIFIFSSTLLFCMSCLSEDDEDTSDLAAPVISASTEGNIQPAYFLSTSAADDEIPVAFTVQDATGIQQVLIEAHSGFDGHTHGKGAMARNTKFKLFTHNEVIRSESMEDRLRFHHSSTIYLDDRNPNLNEDELFLAGPYHFSIQATDIEGNQTSYGDNTIYHTTVYLNKPYAPQAEVTALNIEQSSISGRVYRNMSNGASSDLTFLWIYIQEPHNADTGQEGRIVEQRLWGQSNWPHQSRPNSGDALPNTQEINLAQLFVDDTAFLRTLNNRKLVIWAEDANGNISVKQFN